jgi:hypothetical protein
MPHESMSRMKEMLPCGERWLKSLIAEFEVVQILAWLMLWQWSKEVHGTL